MARNGGSRPINSDPAWEIYRQLRREAKAVIDRKHRDYIESVSRSVNTNPKRFWPYIKARTKSGSIPNIVSHNGVKYSTSEAKAEVFNNFFFSSFTRPDGDTSQPVPTHDDDFVGLRLSEVIISSDEVARLLRNLDVSKASGPDGIPARILKECANQLAPSLCELFNKSLRFGQFPSQWKHANVVPIFKKGDKELVSNYRPVSLLSVLSRVFWRGVFLTVYCTMFHPRFI